MDSGYAWIAIAAVIGVLVVAFDVRGRGEQRRRSGVPGLASDADDIYVALRLSALTETLDHLGLVVKGDGVKSFGLVIDVGLERGAVTLSTLITGDVSLYASDGGGTLGGIDEPEVKTAAVAAIKRAEAAMAAMSPTKTFPLPPSGQARFYLLRSDRSVLTAEDTIERLAGGISDLSPAWGAAHKVFEWLGVTTMKRTS